MRSPYYLNISGAYGLGAYERPDYATLGDLLADMDRLGIWQVVACHNNARDLHPMFGNRYLMEDIDKTPGAKQRVIPAFSAAPPMLVGAGEMEHLQAAFASGQVHCLVLFPKTCRFRIIEIARVLQRLEQYDPVILFDMDELGNERVEWWQQLDELERVGAMFPGMRFIIRRVGWGHFSMVLDTMTRMKNLYLDTSILLTRDALKIVRDQVGADRLIFGLGTGSCVGGAMAGLSYADMPQEEKDRIAWDNFTALFSSGDYRGWLLKNRKTLPGKVQNRFWEPFLDGLGVKETLVIDVHTHIGPFTRSWILPDNEFAGQIRQLEADMERLGIDKLCSQSESELFGEPIKGNRELEAAIGDRKGRFCGNLVINPIYAELYTEEVLDRFYSGGYFRGMKLIPGYIGVQIGDTRLEPIFRYADRRRLYILVHSWNDGFGTPQQIAEVAEKYPNATFIIGHTGGSEPGRRQSERVAQDPRYANCYFEFSGSYGAKTRWEESLKKIDYRRVLFGTDTIVHDMAWELGRLLSMDVPDAWLEAILGANMQRILDRSLLS